MPRPDLNLARAMRDHRIDLRPIMSWIRDGVAVSAPDAGKCTLCGRPYGYGAPVYRNDREQRYAHAACVTGGDQ